MIDSILTSIKKNLGVDEGYTAFDHDITLYINSAFTTLAQLGVGPEGGFVIQDASKKWSDYIPADNLMYESVKNFITISVKLILDPPPTSFAIASLERQRDEIGWRLKTQAEEERWKAANPSAS